MADESDSDHEDPLERMDYQIENNVAQFVDELPVLHNVLPDSESDSDNDDFVVDGREHYRTRRHDGKLWYGQVFYSGIAFKESVLDYALTTGRNIKQYRWDKTKLGYKCAMGGDCEWRIYCSLNKKNKWEVKVFLDNHTCVPNGECEMLKVPVIARLFLDKLRHDPDLMPQKIEEIIRERWKISATRNQCQFARLKALKLIEKEYNIV